MPKPIGSPLDPVPPDPTTPAPVTPTAPVVDYSASRAMPEPDYAKDYPDWLRVQYGLQPKGTPAPIKGLWEQIAEMIQSGKYGKFPAAGWPAPPAAAPAPAPAPQAPAQFPILSMLLGQIGIPKAPPVLGPADTLDEASPLLAVLKKAAALGGGGSAAGGAAPSVAAAPAAYSGGSR